MIASVPYGAALIIVVLAFILGLVAGIVHERARVMRLFHDYKKLGLRVGFTRAYTYLLGAVVNGDTPGGDDR